jgi:hypothetical protein
MIAKTHRKAKIAKIVLVIFHLGVFGKRRDACPEFGIRREPFPPFNGATGVPEKAAAGTADHTRNRSRSAG